MDDDDKVRRNLMVASVLVLLYFWLDVPRDVITERLLGSSANVQLSQWRVWAVITAVIAYQLHRFWSVSGESDEWKRASGLLDSLRSNRLQAMARAEVLHMREHGGEFRLLSPTPPEKYRAIGFNVTQRGDLPPVDARWVQQLNRPISTDPWYHAVHIGPSEDGQILDDRPLLHLYVPARARWLHDVPALLWLLKTRFFSDFGIPYLLGYTALLIALWNLSTAVLS
jgi:hypothetical protein